MANLPWAQAQNSLAPYIRSRQEVSYIRQVLAAHLESQLSHSQGHPQPPILSLVHDSCGVKNFSGNASGLQKEYLKSLRANIEARQEYDRVANANSLANGGESISAQDVVIGSNCSAPNFAGKSNHLDGYITLIRQKQRHERLRILQDYMDKLDEKSTAATSYIIQKGLPLSQLPQVPVDIVAGSVSGDQEPEQGALKELIRDLEQAVFQAKVQLKNEKQLLENINTSYSKDHPGDLDSASRNVQTLQALGRTRNELIKWVEEELGKAGDSAPNESHEANVQHLHGTKESIGDQLILVKAQYGRYVQVRKAFIDITTDAAETDLAVTQTDRKEGSLEDNEVESTPFASWILSPYIRDLQLISNEQKASIQQKSYLTVSLAKQHKETIQLFDRLAHESHLLPAYPQSVTKGSRQNRGQFDMDEMAGKDMLNASHRARAWTYAAESASASMKDAVLARTEQGEAAVEGARETLSILEQLLGRQSRHVEPELDHDIWMSGTTSSRARVNKSTRQARSLSACDFWATLDGNLGVLQRGE